MANLLTDDVRREQYAIHRARRIQCEKWFSLSGGVMVFNIIADIFGTMFSDILEKMTNINPCPVWALPISLAVYALMLFGTSSRRPQPVLIGVLLAFVRIALKPFSLFTIALLPIIVMAVTMRAWVSLSKEDGFPLFDISFDEREKRAAQMERITKHVAIETGKRRTAAPNAGEMSDLLDREGDTPVAMTDLSGYHDRSRHGKVGEQGRTVGFGSMDEF